MGCELKLVGTPEDECDIDDIRNMNAYANSAKSATGGALTVHGTDAVKNRVRETTGAVKSMAGMHFGIVGVLFAAGMVFQDNSPKQLEAVEKKVTCLQAKMCELFAAIKNDLN